jgi:succinate-acetate transporter protein
MNNHYLADSKALGFGVLGIALWMFYITNSGFVPVVQLGIAVHILHIAAIGLLIAGLVAFVRHQGWLAFFFLLWAGLCWAGMYSSRPGQGAFAQGGYMLYSAWFTIVITLVNLYLWFAAMRNARLGAAVSLTVFLLWVSWLLIGLSGFLDSWILMRIGYVVGLASAVVAFYVSAGSIAREHRPDMALPYIPRDEGYPPRDEGYPRRDEAYPRRNEVRPETGPAAPRGPDDVPPDPRHPDV